MPEPVVNTIRASVAVVSQPASLRRRSVLIARHSPSLRTRTGEAWNRVASWPSGRAQVVERSVRFAVTSTCLPVRAALTKAAPSVTAFARCGPAERCRQMARSATTAEARANARARRPGMRN